MKPHVYTHRFVVGAQAIDARNHINNLQYLQWCMEAAEAHWEQEASLELRNSYMWYVLRHTIDYKVPGFLGEELQIQTWVNTAEGVRSEREFRISRPKDGAVLVSAKTLWCLLDAKTGKPTKITEEIRTLFS